MRSSRDFWLPIILALLLAIPALGAHQPETAVHANLDPDLLHPETSTSSMASTDSAREDQEDTDGAS